MQPPDTAQFGRWFEACAPTLVLYARQWLEGPAAEDAVQDAFVQLLQQRPGPDDVPAWLFRTVRNGCISRLRSRRRVAQREHVAARRRSPWFESRIDDLLDAATAQRKLATLPPEDREIIVLRIWGQLSFEQAGAVIGTSAATAFRRYNAALERLRQRLESPCTNPVK